MLTEGEEILLLGLKLAIFGRENEVLIDDLDIKSYGTITFTQQPTKLHLKVTEQDRVEFLELEKPTVSTAELFREPNAAGFGH